MAWAKIDACYYNTTRIDMVYWCKQEGQVVIVVAGEEYCVKNKAITLDGVLELIQKAELSLTQSDALARLYMAQTT